MFRGNAPDTDKLGFGLGPRDIAWVSETTAGPKGATVEQVALGFAMAGIAGVRGVAGQVTAMLAHLSGGVRVGRLAAVLCWGFSARSPCLSNGARHLHFTCARVTGISC